MHASQLSVSLLQFTNPFGILTILAFSLFVNNSEKIELWVPLMGPLLRYLGPLLVPFLLKIRSPLGPLFRIFGSPFDCVTVGWHFLTWGCRLLWSVKSFSHSSHLWLCFFSYRPFEDSFENTLEKSTASKTNVTLHLNKKATWRRTENAQWREVKQMQPMWLCFFSGRRFTFDIWLLKTQ